MFNALLRKSLKHNEIALFPNSFAIQKFTNLNRISMNDFSNLYNLQEFVSYHIIEKESLNKKVINNCLLNDDGEEIAKVKYLDENSYEIDTILFQKTLGTILLNKEKAIDGYTLFTPGGQCGTYLIDNDGDVIHIWHGKRTPGFASLILHGNRSGQLIRSSKDVTASNVPNKMKYGGYHGYIEILNWNNDFLWEMKISGNMLVKDIDNPEGVNRQILAHHDYVYNSANDSIFALVWISYSKEECIEKGRNESLFGTGTHIAVEAIIEIKIEHGSYTMDTIPAENINIVWNMWNILIQESDSTKSNYAIIANNPNKFNFNYYLTSDREDIFHCNSLDYNVERNEFMLSARNMHEVWIINKDSGEIVFRFGNPQIYNQNAPRLLDGQHDANWIQSGIDKGKIVIYNNDWLNDKTLAPHSGEKSKVFILDPLYTLLDGTFAPHIPEKIIHIPSEQHSSYVSNARIIQNNNIITCQGPYGIFTEFDSSGNIVWMFNCGMVGGKLLKQGTQLTWNRPPSNFRCVKYSSSELIFYNLDLKKMGEFHTLQITNENSTFNILNKNPIYTYFVNIPSVKQELISRNSYSISLPNLQQLENFVESTKVTYKDNNSINLIHNFTDLKDYIHVNELMTINNNAMIPGNTTLNDKPSFMINNSASRLSNTGDILLSSHSNTYSLYISKTKFYVLDNTNSTMRIIAEYENGIIWSFQSDNNFVVYSNTGPIYSTNTYDKNVDLTLNLHDTGKLTLGETVILSDLVLKELNLQVSGLIKPITEINVSVKTGTVILNEKEVYTGYTFISPFYTKNSFLIDNKGNIKIEYKTNTSFEKMWSKIIDKGSLKTCCINLLKAPPTTNTQYIEIIDKNNNQLILIDLVSLYPELNFHHDVYVDDNDVLYLISDERISRNKCRMKGLNTNESYILFTTIVKLKLHTDGTVTEHGIWRSYDHVLQNVDSTLSNYTNQSSFFDINFRQGTTMIIDHHHTNGIYINDKLSIMILSLRYYGIILVDIESGIVVKEIKMDNIFTWQHDVTLYDNGDILLFNNNNNLSNPFTGLSQVIKMDKYSRIIFEYDLPISLYSWHVSGVQELPNGNFIVSCDQHGIVLEVNKEKKIVWEYIIPFDKNNSQVQEDVINIEYLSNSIFKVQKFPISLFANVETSIQPSEVVVEGMGDGNIGY